MLPPGERPPREPMTEVLGALMSSGRRRRRPPNNQVSHMVGKRSWGQWIEAPTRKVLACADPWEAWFGRGFVR